MQLRYGSDPAIGTQSNEEDIVHGGRTDRKNLKCGSLHLLMALCRFAGKYILFFDILVGQIVWQILLLNIIDTPTKIIYCLKRNTDYLALIDSDNAHWAVTLADIAIRAISIYQSKQTYCWFLFTGTDHSTCGAINLSAFFLMVSATGGRGSSLPGWAKAKISSNRRDRREVASEEISIELNQ